MASEPDLQTPPVEPAADGIAAPARPSGCLTALALGLLFAVMGGLGFLWIITLEDALFGLDKQGQLLVDLGRTWGYGLLLILPSTLLALLLRGERMRLWRGIALSLLVSGLHIALSGSLSALDHYLAYPGLPAWAPPLSLLAIGLFALILLRGLGGKPDLSATGIGAGLGLLLSAPWAFIGLAGTAPEMLAALLEALAMGLGVSMAAAVIFYYDRRMPREQPIGAALIVAVVYGANIFGLLATRDFLLQSIMLSLPLALAGLAAGALITLPEEDSSRLWPLLTFFTLLFLLPFAFTDGLEGDWMIDEMGRAWLPGLSGSLIAAFVVGIAALVARRLIERQRMAALALLALLTLPGIPVLRLLVLQPRNFGLQTDTFFVVMADQVDSSEAATITAIEERRWAVFEQLTRHAEEDQAELRAWLDERGIAYRSFYLVNGLEIEGGPVLEAQLRAREDVGYLLDTPGARALPPFMPEGGGGGYGSATSITWGLEAIGADMVQEELGISGEGIVVGIADSGVDWTHPAIQEAYLGSAGQHNYTWFDPWEHSTEPTDTNGHGTHVTGTVLGQEYIGVAPGAHWIACRNLARNLGNTADYLACMEFLYAPFPLDGDNFADGDPTRGADITSNSWGCPPEEGCDPGTLSIAVQHLRNAGQAFIVAAGNEGPACDSVAPPGLADAGLTVGAIGQGGALASFSSRGPVEFDGSGRSKPDIVAPGVDVLSSVPDEGYASFQGTSMATPHVAGVVALIWSANPDLIGDIDATEALIFSTASPVSGSGVCGPASNEVGAGLIDAYAAVQAALEMGE